MMLSQLTQHHLRLESTILTASQQPNWPMFLSMFIKHVDSNGQSIKYMIIESRIALVGMGPKSQKVDLVPFET